MWAVYEKYLTERVLIAYFVDEADAKDYKDNTSMEIEIEFKDSGFW